MTIGCLVIHSIPVLFCAGIFVFAPRAKVDPRDEKAGTLGKTISAWGVTEDFIMQHVKSPSTADFGGIFNSGAPSDHVIYQGNDEYQVVGWVDAQNAFGATVRTDFIVKVHDNRDGTWSLVELPDMVQR